MISGCHWSTCLQGEQLDAGHSGNRDNNHIEADHMDEQPNSSASGQAGANGPEAPPLTALSMLVQVSKHQTAAH